MNKIRIPIRYLREIIQCVDGMMDGPNYWKFTTDSGNILAAERVTGLQLTRSGLPLEKSRPEDILEIPRPYDSIDFEYNPGD